MDVPAGTFYLGGIIEPGTGERTSEPVFYESHHLTTHGVIVGMTGSGKTGLGIDLLEEALLSGIPCLVIDPKGDMGNLELVFPDLAASDFRPWLDEAGARRDGKTLDEAAEVTAGLWQKGLASWDIDGERLQRLTEAAEVTIYTPGSRSGVPLNVLGSLAAPQDGADEETMRDEIESFVSSLLTLAGIDADPISSPEHILLATIIEQAWTEGRGLDLATLIGSVQKPPFRKLGVFDLDTFFPPKDRTALAMQLNGLVASPSFSSWLDGAALDIDELLHGEEERPRAAIVYLAHLSDSERQFVVTLLLSKMVTWMRSQGGTSDLRALIYMDEVFGFAPPTAEPPSKKPILTILKQARAHGVGMVLSTQNPVDLDYKAMSNAGTWMIGRLQTERDKARILEGIESASGDVDVDAFDRLISDLGKRQFVLHSTRTAQPAVFTTRWAMSYLAGPLTKVQLEELTDEMARNDPPPPGTAPTPPGDSVAVAPAAAERVRTGYADPSAPWLAGLGADRSDDLSAAAAALVHLRYDDTRAGVDHAEDIEVIVFPLPAAGLPDDAVHVVDYDERDLSDDAPAAAAYALPDAPIDSAAFWRSLERALEDHLYRNRSISILRCPDLKLYSRVGESDSAFRSRVSDAAEDAADSEVAKLKDKYQTRIRRVQDQLRAADRRVRELETDVATRRQQEMVSGAGDLLGALLGGRRRSSGLSRAASRRAQTRRTEERLATAEGKYSDKAAELEDLEDRLADDILEITERWNAAGDSVEMVEIPLDKTDVAAEPLRLVWIPARLSSP